MLGLWQSISPIKIYLTWARPGEGKSSDTARITRKLLAEYARVEKRYPQLPKRELWSNMRYSRAFEEKHLKRDPTTGHVINPDGHLCYWENPKQLRDVRDADIIVDEAANYFPADGWGNLPRWLRKTFAQHRHRGLRIFLNTQDYMAVDINLRRMVGVAYRVRKIFSSPDISATRPPVRYIYGLIVRQQFDPAQIESEGVNSPTLMEVTSIPTFFWLSRKLVEIYDTTQDIPEYMPNALEHEEKVCAECGKVHVSHRAA